MLERIAEKFHQKRYKFRNKCWKRYCAGSWLIPIWKRSLSYNSRIPSITNGLSIFFHTRKVREWSLYNKLRFWNEHWPWFSISLKVSIFNILLKMHQKNLKKNLHFNISMVFSSSPIKIWGKSVKGFRSYDRTNK